MRDYEWSKGLKEITEAETDEIMEGLSIIQSSCCLTYSQRIFVSAKCNAAVWDIGVAGEFWRSLSVRVNKTEMGRRDMQ